MLVPDFRDPQSIRSGAIQVFSTMLDKIFQILQMICYFPMTTTQANHYKNF